MLTYLLLAKQCGAKVDDSLLHRTLVHFFRFAASFAILGGGGYDVFYTCSSSPEASAIASNPLGNPCGPCFVNNDQAGE